VKYKEEFYISLVGEAFDGYTEVSFQGKDIYIKHLSLKDQRYLHKYYDKYVKIALDKGLESEEDRIKAVMEDGMWSSEEDTQISTLRFETDNLKKTQKVLPLRSQREKLEEDIDAKLSELSDLEGRRREVIGKTAEDYANRRSNDEILRFLLFKDQELTEHLYTDDQFGDLEVWEVAKLTLLQKSIQERLSDEKIQEAVLRPFFAMYLSFCENSYAFYEKPITQLTIYQLRVILFGRMFYNIFQYTEDIPDHIREDPKKLLAFSESQRNKDSNKPMIKDDADASAVFGATDEDVADLGGSKGGVSLSSELEKHGGKLDMKQMMRLAGHDV
tara:strand:+ start:2178 stop:3167 length:990 start_codon:yes stop_codon:yes gene_type:complete